MAVSSSREYLHVSCQHLGVRTIWGHLNAVVGRGAGMTRSPAGSPLLAGGPCGKSCQAVLGPQSLSPLPAPASAHGQVA